MDSYAWQKAYEAVHALSGTTSRPSRLKAAGFALDHFPLQRVPHEVAVQALITRRAFTMYPDAWPTENGTIEALIELIPEERHQRLVDHAVRLFGIVCENRYRDDLFLTNQELREVDLKIADRWEFLDWQVGRDKDPDFLERYVAYSQNWLPNFPDDALIEWIGRHGAHGLEHWPDLDLESLSWQTQRWTNEQVATIRTVDPAFCAVGANSHGAGHLSRDGDWHGQQVRTLNTWAHPVLVMDNRDRIATIDPEVPEGWVLIDGHTRLSRLINLSLLQRQGQLHYVVVATVVGLGDDRVSTDAS